MTEFHPQVLVFQRNRVQVTVCHHRRLAFYMLLHPSEVNFSKKSVSGVSQVSRVSEGRLEDL